MSKRPKMTEAAILMARVRHRAFKPRAWPKPKRNDKKRTRRSKIG